MSDDSAELTDEMAVQHWFRIAADTDNLQSHGPFQVRPGSELAEDDAQSDPYQVSHCAQGFLNSGIDHMHAVKTLILGDKPIIHADSDYTLLRGALENLAVALWVLRPTDRSVRIERALRCEAQNYRDQDRATKDLGLPNPHPLQSNLARVADVGGRAGCDKKIIRAGYGSTEVLRYAARQTSIIPSPHLMWQVCSGFAHGRRWASLGMSATEIKPGPGERVSTIRFTTDHKRLLGAGWPAHGLMTEVVRLFTERAG